MLQHLQRVSTTLELFFVLFCRLRGEQPIEALENGRKAGTFVSLGQRFCTIVFSCLEWLEVGVERVAGLQWG